MSRCMICSTSGSPGNTVWNCPICGRIMCGFCLEKQDGKARNGDARRVSTQQCPKCDEPMKKLSR